MWASFIDSAFFSFAFPILLILFVVAGYWLAQRNYVKKGNNWKMSGAEASIIGFFALLISFTLLTSGNSMRERVNLVHQQSDALAQLKRSGAGLPDTLRANINAFIVQHIRSQLDFQQDASIGKDSLISRISANNARFLQWLTLTDKRDSARQFNLSSLMPAYNAVCSTTFRMAYSYEERTPLLIILLIVFGSLLIGLLIGFMNGFHESRHYLVPLIYIVIVSLTVQGIRDLDNPFTGTIRPSYKNLVNILEMVQSNP